MPSNISKFQMRLCKRFTSVELCDLLDISIEDFIDAFEERINEFQSELEEELDD